MRKFINYIHEYSDLQQLSFQSRLLFKIRLLSVISLSVRNTDLSNYATIIIMIIYYVLYICFTYIIYMFYILHGKQPKINFNFK